MWQRCCPRAHGNPAPSHSDADALASHGNADARTNCDAHARGHRYACAHLCAHGNLTSHRNASSPAYRRPHVAIHAERPAL